MIQQHQAAIFIADAPALDFLNSVATPIDKPVDWIDGGDGLLDWLNQARLIPSAVLEAVRAQALPGELDRVGDQARGLREWFREFVREHMGKPITTDALKELGPLNRLLDRDEGFGQIAANSQAGQSPFEFRMMRRWRSPDSVLFPIAEAVAKFVCEEDFTTVKACEGHACTLMFVDHTRRRARRWCDMATCGNRAKQAAHRSRLKSQHSSDTTAKSSAS